MSTKLARMRYVVIGAALLTALGATPQAASSATSCGSYTPGGGHDAAKQIRATNVGCDAARKIVKQVMRDGVDSPSGYRCPQPYGATKITCRKGSKVIAWRVVFQ